MADVTYIPGTPRLACTVAGTGPPVFFLHGVGGRRQNWSSQIASISAEHTAIAWDARGYGRSADYDGELDFPDFGDDLARALDHLGIDQAHMVGLSMGARILLDFYPRYSDRVASLTLCDCVYSFETALSPEKQREYIDLRERPLREGKTFADLAPDLIASLVSPTCSDEARHELRSSLESLRAEPYLKTIRATVGFDRSASLCDIEVPVQLIFGSEDRLTPPSIGQDMLDQIPDSRLAIIEGAGHLSNLEAPDSFNRILAGFLAEHAVQASRSEGTL